MVSAKHVVLLSSANVNLIMFGTLYYDVKTGAVSTAPVFNHYFVAYCTNFDKIGLIYN